MYYTINIIYKYIYFFIKKIYKISADLLHFLCVLLCIENEDEFEGCYGKLDLRVLKKDNVNIFFLFFNFEG